MCRTSLALALGLLAPPTAHAAPPVTPAPAPATVTPAPVTLTPAVAPPAAVRPGEQERLDLEQQTRLDLSQPWQRYLSQRKGESFYQFVEKDFRRKRDIGRGLTFGGLSGLVVGVSLFTIGIPQPDQPIPLTLSGDVIMAVSGVTTIVGAVMWGIFFKKMEKLEVAEYDGLARRPRVRLQALSPTGFRLAF